ncbi:PREDICTED: chlorophyllase-2, chloroplastic-like [Ipomoea nil]|uniref:chlorophyllase-2, chloroplastic-like n=1 Tax=Ipomoea nil TaxID=35883 RepID=UPI000901D089|nr:PREDICTED: chlorophyllase-2, chloroplastic-like [Ipomoea nil]
MAVTSSSSGVTSVFGVGKYTTQLLTVEPNKATPNAPPKPLLIATPTETGDFPVLMFLPGYMILNSFYSQLLQHIASHGFIAVAPQLYLISCCDATDEIKSSAEVTNWLSEGLTSFLPSQVQPDLKKLALSGHSRGGKVAFALALGKTATADLKFSAIIGVDPVGGTCPDVLNSTPDYFDLNMPAMVIGSGLGDVKKNLLSCPCAPKGSNYAAFYSKCRAPACCLVAKDYGHTDMLDDDTRGSLRGMLTYCMCKNGPARAPMRAFVGGAVVAFLRGFLESDMNPLMGIIDQTETAPVELQPVDSKDLVRA